MCWTVVEWVNTAIATAVSLADEADLKGYKPASSVASESAEVFLGKASGSLGRTLVFRTSSGPMVLVG